jgi:hypothetical protein
MFYMRQLEVWLKLYRDQLLARWPPIVENAQEFTHNIFRHIAEIEAINTAYLLRPLRFRYLEQGPLVTAFSDIFDLWLSRAQRVYADYCTDYLRSESLVQNDIRSNPKFSQFMQDMRSHPDARRLGWDTYIRAPIHQLHKYLLLLKTSSKHNVGISQANDKETLSRIDRLSRTFPFEVISTCTGTTV